MRDPEATPAEGLSGETRLRQATAFVDGVAEDLIKAAVPRADDQGLSAPAVPVRREQFIPCGTTWSQAAGRPEVWASLEKLPAGVEFSDDFPEPIRYDADQRKLVYRGFMTAMSYNYLRLLSTDLAYIAALDQVNTKSSIAMLSPAPRRRSWFWGFGAAAVVASAMVFWVMHHHWVH